MKAVAWFGILSLSFISAELLSGAANAQTVAERIIDEEQYFPGVGIRVVIRVTGEPDQQLTIIETPPVGWKILRPTRRGLIEDNSILWTWIATSNTTTLRYDLIPSITTGERGDFEGTINGHEIVGVSNLPRGTLQPVGIFEHHLDIGHPLPGSATYDAERQEYIIAGARDPGDPYSGHYAYVEMEGDFSFEARMRVENPSTEEWGGAMTIMNEMSVPFVHSGMWVWVDGSLLDKWDLGAGESWNILPEELINQKTKLVRIGDEVETYYTDPNTGEWTLFSRRAHALSDPVYIVILSLSSDPKYYSTSYFTEVDLTPLETSGCEEWELY